MPSRAASSSEHRSRDVSSREEAPASPRNRGTEPLLQVFVMPQGLPQVLPMRVVCYLEGVGDAPRVELARTEVRRTRDPLFKEPLELWGEASGRGGSRTLCFEVHDATPGAEAPTALASVSSASDTLRRAGRSCSAAQGVALALALKTPEAKPVPGGLLHLYVHAGDGVRDPVREAAHAARLRAADEAAAAALLPPKPPVRMAQHAVPLRLQWIPSGAPPLHRAAAPPLHRAAAPPRRRAAGTGPRRFATSTSLAASAAAQAPPARCCCTCRGRTLRKCCSGWAASSSRCLTGRARPARARPRRCSLSRLRAPSSPSVLRPPARTALPHAAPPSLGCLAQAPWERLPLPSHHLKDSVVAAAGGKGPPPGLSTPPHRPPWAI